MTTPHAPLYIPGEICGTIGVDPATKPDECLAVVQQQVSAGNISAPQPVTPALLDVINQAHEHGIDLKIVVLEHNPPNDTPLRDIATVVGSATPRRHRAGAEPELRRQLQHALPTRHLGDRRRQRQNRKHGGVSAEFPASARDAAVSVDRIHHRCLDRGIGGSDRSTIHATASEAVSNVARKRRCGPQRR